MNLARPSMPDISSYLPLSFDAVFRVLIRVPFVFLAETVDISCRIVDLRISIKVK
jgi:hypothetical protein